MEGKKYIPGKGNCTEQVSSKNSAYPELQCRQEKGNGKRCKQLRWTHPLFLSEHTLPLGCFTDINILGITACFIQCTSESMVHCVLS